MNVDAQRNTIERQAVADVRRRVRPIFNGLTGGQPIRGQNVSLLAIDEMQQCDAGVAAGVVLNRRHLGLHAVFVADEVNHAILLLMAAAAMPRGDPALIVASAFFAERHQKRFLGPSPFGQLLEIAHARAAAASGNRIVLTNSHDYFR